MVTAATKSEKLAGRLRTAKPSTTNRRVECGFACDSVAALMSNSAEHDQDQDNDQHEAEAAAAIIAGAIKTAADKTAKASKQRDNENDEQDGSYGHGTLSSLGFRRARVGRALNRSA